MRRDDRAVTDPIRIREIIAGCTCCRLGLCDQGRAYVVPLDFGFVEREGHYTFYFHGAKEGRKIDLIRVSGWAAFEMDRGHEWVRGDRASANTSRFQCVMGGGPVTLLETAEEKREWIAGLTGVTCGSDAFFPFGDNVERARRSGARYIVQPGGSIRDDHVIETADKYGMTMCFTGMRLFHH